MNTPKPDPHNLDAEQATLGAAILSPAALATVAAMLKSTDFYTEANRILFETILTMNKEGTEVDVLTLSHALAKAGKLERVGGMAALALLSESVPSAANVEYYAEIVAAAAQRRNLIEFADHLKMMAQEDGLKSTDLLDQAARRLSALTATAGDSSKKGPFFNASEYVESLSDYQPGADFKPRLFNGLPFPRGTTSYVGARTGRGKSAVLVNLAREALEGGKAVLFVTLELSNAQLFNRFLLVGQRAAGGDMSDHRDKLPQWCLTDDGEVNAHAAAKYWTKEARDTTGKTFPRGFRDSLTFTLKAITEGRLVLADVRGFKLSRIFQVIRETPTDLVLIDYIQKLPSVEGGRQEGFQRLQDVSQQLIDLSVKTDRVFIAAAQFTRPSDAAKAAGKDDAFTDSSFREAGDLEQDAHNALGIGWKSDKKGRFYEVLKARESHHTGQRFNLEWDGLHGWMTRGTTYNGDKPKDDAGGSGTKKAAGGIF